MGMGVASLSRWYKATCKYRFHARQAGRTKVPKLGIDPVIHPSAALTNVSLGRYVEIAEGVIMLDSALGDYSYLMRFCDVANADIGKFANIASFARIGATDHPMERASQHHFLYRSDDYWDDAAPDAAFFARRAARRVRIGHDVWIGHGAMAMPEVNVGHGAVLAAKAVATRDVPPYAVVAGAPARVVKRRHPEPVAERLMALGWWDWDHDRLRAALPDFRALSAEAFLEKYEA
jgi:phosphonate metabolism protein (transferase hexapeptide repeat family)